MGFVTQFQKRQEVKPGDLVKVKSSATRKGAIGLVVDIEPRLFTSIVKRDKTEMVHVLGSGGGRFSWFDWQLEVISTTEQKDECR